MDTTDLFTRLTSIVRAQNARTPDSGTASGDAAHEAMSDDQLDAELTIVEKLFIDRMDTRHTDPANHADLADTMRAALATYVEAVTRRDTVHRPRDRALAACDVDRQRSYVRTLMLFPECADLLASLDVVEHEARLVEATTCVLTDSGRYVQTIDDTAIAAMSAGAMCHVNEREAHGYTLFLVALAPYTRLRSHLPEEGPELDTAAAAVLRLASRIDRAREDMADAAARARRRPGSSGPGNRMSASV